MRNRTKRKIKNNHYSLMFYFLFIFFLKINEVICDEKTVWHFWGPGLEGAATVPARYFYGIILDKRGNQIGKRSKIFINKSLLKN